MLSAQQAAVEVGRPIVVVSFFLVVFKLNQAIIKDASMHHVDVH